MEIGPNFLSVQTAATGTNWAAFPSYRCSTLSVLNNSGTSINLRRKGEADASRVLLLKDGQAWMARSLTNSDQLEIRRADTANTQVTLHGEAE
jgi:hypothetical protein